MLPICLWHCYEVKVKRLFRYVKLGDIALLGLFLSAAVLSVLLIWRGTDGGSILCIAESGELRLNIDDDGEHNLYGPLGITVLELKEGEVRVKSSPCPDKQCVRMGKLGPLNPAIACVPNKIIIRLEGKEEQPDAITR